MQYNKHPAGIENGMFQIGKLSVSSLTSTLGTSAIAANAVAGNITTFLNVPANAVGMAVRYIAGLQHHDRQSN